MKILSLSWFGFTMLTLVHAVSIPVTYDPVSPPEDDLVTEDHPDNPPTYDDLVTEDHPDNPPTYDDLVTEDYPDNPPTYDDLVTEDHPDNPPTHDYVGDLMDGTDGDYHFDFTCPDGWTKHSTQCLLFVPQNMTWDEAKENCASRGSLAAVYSDIQAQEIYSELKSAGHDGGPVWVGDNKAPGDFSWSFAKFCDEQSSRDENNCLQISFDDFGSGCLNDMKCDAELPSVCAILIY